MCHKGYLSLFPFLLELLPPSSPRLGPILDLLRDPEHLWSPYGIRSLSASHPEFGKGENYWKGPIWIQMNYLALRALHKVGYIISFELEIVVEILHRPTLPRKVLSRKRQKQSTLHCAKTLLIMSLM